MKSILQGTSPILLSQMAQHGVVPRGPVVPEGVGVVIDLGADYGSDTPCNDGSLAKRMKDGKEWLTGHGATVSSTHFAGSPSLNEAKYSDGRPPFYDVDLTNPNESLTGHVIDVLRQLSGDPLTDDVFNDLYRQGQIKQLPWY